MTASIVAKTHFVASFLFKCKVPTFIQRLKAVFKRGSSFEIFFEIRDLPGNRNWVAGEGAKRDSNFLSRLTESLPFLYLFCGV